MEERVADMEEKEFVDEQLSPEPVEIKSEIRPAESEEKFPLDNGRAFEVNGESNAGNLKPEPTNEQNDLEDLEVLNEVKIESTDERNYHASSESGRTPRKESRFERDPGDSHDYPPRQEERRDEDRRSRERSRRRSGDTNHLKEELAPKLNDLEGKIIFCSKSLQVGVIRTEGQSGSIYIMFHFDSLTLPEVSAEKIEGLRVYCDAWLMQKSSYIPYLAAVAWQQGQQPPTEEQKKRIQSNPTPNDMDVYQVSEELTRMLKRDREGSRDRDDRRSHKRHKKSKKRSRSRDRRRSRSDDRHSPDKDRKKHKRDNSSERRRRRHGSKERRFREESPEPRRHRGGSGEDGGGYDDYRSSRGGYRGRRMRGPMPRGMPGRAPLPASNSTGSKPKLAIGRNVFPDSEEEGEEGGAVAATPAQLPAPLRARGRGRFIRISRGALPGLKLKKLVHGEDVDLPVMKEDRPGLGFAPSGARRVSRSNARWQRWQQLSRGKEDDEEEGGDKFSSREGKSSSATRDASPVSGDSELDEYGRSSSHKKSYSSRSHHSSHSSRKRTKSRSPMKPNENGMRVLILTYENEEVGILSGPKDTKVLFHISQVWIKHQAAGFCPFLEIYPTSELSKHFYPGREVSCHVREIPKTRDVKGQAEAVWLQGFPPDDALFRTRELPAELNFHLAQYQSGKCGKLDLVISVDKHSSIEGTIQEYVTHESGLVKLVGKDEGSVLFHLDQVWIFEDGRWMPFKDVMKKPVGVDYLPIGSLVSLSLRKLPCSANSHLRYQAMVIWNKEVCRTREAQNTRVDNWTMFARRGLEDGKVPPAYVSMFSLPENHLQLIKSLENHFDQFKRLAKLDMKAINAVPVLLNMLPADWEAKVYKVIDDENGVIVIKHRRGHNMSEDNKLKISKMFCTFHVEDVYTGTGEKFRKSPSEFMLQLHGQEVDLTARSIVGEGAYEGVFTAACQVNLSLTNPNVACPVLQAVTVFLKPPTACADSEVNTRLAPKPTYLRSYPDSFHYSEPGTAFFLDAQLLIKLDLKALNFFNATIQAKLQKEIINGIPMAHFGKCKKSNLTDKKEQIELIKEMSKIDTNKSSNLIYGLYRELPSPPIRPRYPHSLTNVNCAPKLLFQQGLYAKEGLVLCEIPLHGGHKIAVYAFFDISNYKFALQKEIRVKDFAEMMPIYDPPQLKANVVLVNSNNPVPYVATALYNPNHWHRFLEHSPKLDDIYLQKFERVTSQITQSSVKTLGMVPTNIPPPILHQPPPAVPPFVNPHSVVGGINVLTAPPGGGSGLPPTSKPPPPRLLWSNKDLLREVVGRVTSLIDENYGLAVVRFAAPKPPYDRYRAIVLFDTCDLWLGEHTATELNMSLNQCIREGDYIKVKALLVPESENLKNIRYLATGVVSGRTKSEVRHLPLPDQERLENIDRIHPDKLNNFYQVVSVVCANIPGEAEEEAEGVSTDEETLPARPLGWSQQGGGPPPSSAPPPNVPSTDDSFSLASMMSMDAFEEEREKKRNAKALECTHERRKMGYDKDVRERVLSSMKLPNQLMWKCVDCQITCAKPGMEKHIQLKAHWDKVLAAYNRKLDAMRPNMNY